MVHFETTSTVNFKALIIDFLVIWRELSAWKKLETTSKSREALSANKAKEIKPGTNSKILIRPSKDNLNLTV